MSLEAPAEPQSNIADAGAHELHADSSDDHFSDAEEAHKQLSAPPSPVPVTRVERVDDEPSYGEVPGTAAYKIRTQDAVPDEMEIIPDGQRSRSTSRLSESDRPSTPGGTPIPKMIVERVDDKPAHGEVPGTAAFEMRKADAEPDEVRQAPEEASATLERSPTPNDRSRSDSHESSSSTPTIEQHHSSITTNTEETELGSTPVQTAATNDDYDEFNDGQVQEQSQQEDEGNGFEDDFDDFEEGAEAGEDDFGDFDDGFQEPEPAPTLVSAPVPEPVQDPLAHLPNLSFADFQTPEDILKTITPHLHEIFPEMDLPSLDQPTSPTSTNAAFNNPILTDRSASLWSQLVAPPPLQPPNWIRSRIRRLFLVSLGVPVDLDEILPASKQKKLILPNINLDSGSAPRGSISKLRKEGQNDSSTSVASGTAGSDGAAKKKKKDTDRRGPPPPPEFDANSASLVSSTTETAMSGYSDDELKAHVARLEELIGSASEVLEYWLKRKDSAVGDKEAFEGVIENLVGFVRKNRDSRIFK